MVVDSTSILCIISFTHRQVQRFHLLPTIYIHKQERCHHQSKNTRFCVISYDPYLRPYIREFLMNADGIRSLSMKHGWSSGFE
jgi:hypothetical protein